MPKILDGAAIADAIKQEVAEEVRTLVAHGIRPGLAAGRPSRPSPAAPRDAANRFGPGFAPGGASRHSPVNTPETLAAMMLKSESTDNNWPDRYRRGVGWICVTPREFCDVSAVITHIPGTPSAWNVLMSAWIPAPPEESEPATVKTHLGGF